MRTAMKIALFLMTIAILWPLPKDGPLRITVSQDWELERNCLAAAIYFESRGEPIVGQMVVGQVILNRTRDKRWPSTICGVVFQNAHRYLKCQFTFACEGKDLVIKDADAWAIAESIASALLNGELVKDIPSSVADANHYHAEYVTPWWIKTQQFRGKIGIHRFYRG